MTSVDGIPHGDLDLLRLIVAPQPATAARGPGTDVPYTHCYCEENVYRTLARVVPHLNQPIPPPLDGTPCSSGDDAVCVIESAYAVFVSSYTRGKLNTPTAAAPILPWDGSLIGIFAAPGKAPVVWDYHVVAMFRVRSTNLGGTVAAAEGAAPQSVVRHVVLDADSAFCYATAANGSGGVPKPGAVVDTRRLHRCIPAEAFASLLRDVKNAPPCHLRVVPVEALLNTLHSDRSHMLLPPAASRWYGMSPAERAARGPLPAVLYQKPPPQMPPPAPADLSGAVPLASFVWMSSASEAPGAVLTIAGFRKAFV